MISSTLVLIIGLATTIVGEDLIGCKYQPSLCSESETCIDDGVFGNCQSEPFDLYHYQLSPEEFQLVRLELERLVLLEQEWNSVGVQCALRYFLLVVRYGLQYDVNFCNVRRPENVLRLLQTVSKELGEKNDELNVGDDNNVDDEPKQQENERIVDNLVEQLIQESSDRSKKNLQRSHRLRQVDDTDDDDDDDDDEASATIALNENEEKLLNHLIWQVMNGEKPDLSELSERQLDKFIIYVELLEKLLGENGGLTEGEVGVVKKDVADGLQKFLYKKDEEKLGILDQGTGNKEHKIQTRYPPNVTPPPSNKNRNKEFTHTLKLIQGNRVYVRLNKNVTVDDLDYLEDLSEFLDKNIAAPNNLTFNDFKISSPNEVSFEVHSVEEYTPDWLRRIFKMPPIPVIDAGAVAEQTYHLIKKVPSLNSLRPVESGVGSGVNAVPIKRAVSDEDDNFVLPTLVVCGLVIGTLIVVLGLYAYRSRARAKAALHLLAADLEGKPSKDYQELCRQRMSGKTDERLESMSGTGGIVGTLAQRLSSQSEPSPPAQTHSPRSSTSSWSEEPVQTNMDISTGHTILTYMENHLMNKDRLEQEWSNLEGYQADVSATGIAESSENEAKNRYEDVLPYDHTRVVLSQANNAENSTYINASFICDHDPRNPSYITTQGPLHETTADFWQMVWEQGSVVIVNLTKLTEGGEVKCVRYWPENGSEVYHIYEVHLVSEHIWCTDYLVRSFYLKNLRTQETRTVTQFHFLTWPEEGLPASTKALLDFRRKVNKSYRGRSCPIVLHCSDGSGRSGTYCLLDMVLNRINKGVKEIDIAATLEHLRDQRMKFVKNVEQFEFVLTCVAEEVQAILKALPQ